MSPELFEELLGESGQRALAMIGPEPIPPEKLPAWVDKLGKAVGRELAKAALETAWLRHRAKAKFAMAERMYFDKEALEMATAEPVAGYRAKRFREADFARVYDLGCGIGGDTLAMARVGCNVTAMDAEPVRLLMAKANLQAHGLQAEFRLGDVLQLEPEANAGLFADPGRRPGGKRTLLLATTEPPLPALLERFGDTADLAVKAAPGTAWAELRPLPASVEFVSYLGELKECLLWFGRLRSEPVRATLIGTAEADTISFVADPDSQALPPVQSPGQFLYLPDPAVTRAGLAAALADSLDAWRIDAQQALFSSDTRLATPFAKGYRVLETLPAQPRKVAKRLRERQIDRLTPINCGSGINPDEFFKSCKLASPGPLVLLFCRMAGKPATVLTEPLT